MVPMCYMGSKNKQKEAEKQVEYGRHGTAWFVPGAVTFLWAYRYFCWVERTGWSALSHQRPKSTHMRA